MNKKTDINIPQIPRIEMTISLFTCNYTTIQGNMPVYHILDDSQTIIYKDSFNITTTLARQSSVPFGMCCYRLKNL